MAVEEDPPPAVPEWVVSFGDMMSLLLTFFIMLVSMSEIRKDDDKFQAFLIALKSKFGDDMEKLMMGIGTGRPVMQQLIALGIDPRRIRIVASASNEPLARDDDPVLARENSRVELFLLGEVPERPRAEDLQVPTNAQMGAREEAVRPGSSQA